MSRLVLDATCNMCGNVAEVQPPNLPSTGGELCARDDPVLGWQVEAYVCGTCVEGRPRTWPCAACGGTGPISGNYCSVCGAVRPDPALYVPNWDLIAKEERMWQQEARVIALEWEAAYPNWRRVSR